MVTKWPRIVFINHSRGNFSEIMLAHRTKKPNRGRFPLYHYLSYIQILNLTDFFVDIDGDIQIMLQTLMNFMLVLGSLLTTRNRLRTKQTWVITRQTEVISHIQWTALQPCVQCWCEPSSHHIEMRHPHTGTFNAMWNTTWAASDRGEMQFARHWWR